MKNKEQVFPFVQTDAHNSAWFKKWYAKYYPMIREKHGWYPLGSHMEKTFSYSEVHAEITSEDTATIKFYDTYDSVTGGRGDLFLEKKAKDLKDDVDFQKVIRSRMTNLAVKLQIELEIDAKVRQMASNVAGLHINKFGTQMNAAQVKDTERLLRNFVERITSF